MIKKIALLAILIGIFIAGNLFSGDEPIYDPLIIHVVAQQEVDWELRIWDGVAIPYWNIPGQGTWNVNAVGCQGDYYEMWALDETIFIESGTLPFSNWFEIEIPITVPSWEDPEE